jgi:hypothetical protein
MDQIYEDKLDGKISEEFSDRKHAEYRDQERGLQVQISRLSEPVKHQNVLTVLTATDSGLNQRFDCRLARVSPGLGVLPVADSLKRPNNVINGRAVRISNDFF